MFLGVAVGVPYGRDLIPWDASGHQFVGDVVIDAVAPGGGVHAHVAEDHLRAARGFGSFPDTHHVFNQGIDLGVGKITSIVGE